MYVLEIWIVNVVFKRFELFYDIWSICIIKLQIFCSEFFLGEICCKYSDSNVTASSFTLRRDMNLLDDKIHNSKIQIIQKLAQRSILASHTARKISSLTMWQQWNNFIFFIQNYKIYHKNYILWNSDLQNVNLKSFVI